jgi:hypothetical protein
MSKQQDYQVSASFNFVKIFQNLEPLKSPFKYPNELPDQIKIATVISKYLESGWEGDLKGKNHSSDNVPPEDVNWLEKVKYAQKHNLWHYHVGIPFYENSEYGYLTSYYVLHYQKLTETHIKLIDLDTHSPMGLPKESYMEGDIQLGGSDEE